MNFYKARNNGVLLEELQAGDELRISESQIGERQTMLFQAKIHGQWQEVACTSKKFYESICQHIEKGYIPCSAKVQFVVNWKNKDTGRESNVVLPILKLKKHE